MKKKRVMIPSYSNTQNHFDTEYSNQTFQCIYLSLARYFIVRGYLGIIVDEKRVDQRSLQSKLT